jgi:4-deoxy-L-threo-5-hexosulose-uronate ketol-isomerase
MNVRILPDDRTYRHLPTADLRAAFVLGDLFRPGAVSMEYCDADRAIVGGALPAPGAPLRLEASRKEMAAEFFLERREVGIAVLAGSALIRTDGEARTLGAGDMLYVGRGTRSVEFQSPDPRAPGVLYFVSFPAHAQHPTALIRRADAQRTPLGSPEEANRRTICKYIHPGGAPSCQLVMGLTELERGSVWNTMPPHTHLRRSEVYLYYDLAPDAAVIHLMGRPDETRSLVLRDRQAVISPPWSVHCGAGTTRYAFIWAMGGENQEFSDMDAVGMKDLL